MKLSDFDYDLPKNLIATKACKKRDHSRLLVLGKDGKIQDKKFYNILDFLRAGDCLVLNNSKVIPARLFAKKESGGKVEVLLHQKEYVCPNKNDNFLNFWNVVLGGRKLKVGQILHFDNNLQAKIIKNNQDKTWLIAFNQDENTFAKTINSIGQIPLPPYILKQRKEQKTFQDDYFDYQTVYADDKKSASVAAPTAGLHFTKDLLKKIEKKGVKIFYVSLHIGLGTFAPVKTENIKDHKMHKEFVEVDKETLNAIFQAKKSGKNIIAVGTTSLRSLEAIASRFGLNHFFEKDFADYVDIFIYPGYKFKVVNKLITNFHLPQSTLLMLVSALVGKKNIDKAYQYAIKNNYRFYSYGDAMFLE